MGQISKLSRLKARVASFARLLSHHCVGTITTINVVYSHACITTPHAEPLRTARMHDLITRLSLEDHHLFLATDLFLEECYLLQ